MYYRQSEQPLRLAMWYSMNGLAIVAGGLFAYGVGHISGNIALWKYPFLICGSLSIAWSVVLAFKLPDNPANAWFLTDEERIMAVVRIKDNQTGIESKVFKIEQVREALKDPKVVFNAIGGGSGNILGGVSAFGGLLIRSFGFSTLQTTLLQLPTGVIEIVGLFIFSLVAMRIPNSRLALALLAVSISFAGSVMLYAIPLKQKWALLSG